MKKNILKEHVLSGEHVCEKRQKQGMPQEELAEKTGMSRTQIGRIERGEAKNSRIDTVKKIANALQVNIEELLCEEDEKEQE